MKKVPCPVLKEKKEAAPKGKKGSGVALTKNSTAFRVGGEPSLIGRMKGALPIVHGLEEEKRER